MKLDKNLPLFHSKRGRQLELGNSNIRRSFRATYFIFSLHAENGDDFVVDVRPVAYLLIFYLKLEGRRRVVGFIPVLPSCCRTKLQFLVIGMDFTAFWRLEQRGSPNNWPIAVIRDFSQDGQEKVDL